jgi:hypothetical protein
VEASQQSTAELGPELRPARHPDVHASTLDGDCVLYDPRVGRGYVLNATGAQIWELCNGQRTLRDLAQEITSAYQIDVELAVADVRELVYGLQAAGLLVG